MVPVVNIPIIELILHHIKHFGITDAIANTHYLAESIHERFDNNLELGINLNYIHESNLSGTAGGVKKCESFFEKDDTFIVISGDALTDVNLDELVEKHKSTGAIATMALKEVDCSDVSHFGVVVINDKSKILGFQEKPSIEEAKSNFVNTGIYVFEKNIFKYIPENTFYDFAKNVFPSLMASNEMMCGHVINDYWSDIGTTNQYRLASSDVLSGKVKVDIPHGKSKFGWVSSDAIISQDVTFNGNSIIGNKTIIKEKAKLYGNNTIGNNCIIEEGALIRNSIIWDNVIIQKEAIIDGCIIASNVKIGNKAILTNGSIIPDGCHVLDYETLSHNTKLNSGDKYGSNFGIDAIKA